MKTTKLIIIAVVLVALGLIIHFPLQKLARKHVNEKTAVEDHPLLCTNCHLYITGNKLVTKLINTDYISPFNLAVSGDGSKLYIVAQEASQLLIADTKTGKVLNRIKVGKMPHSVILDEAKKRAYVSNEWADNVSVVDIETARVVDTLLTGNGPAGLSLSRDGKYLYTVNAFSSDISVIDVDSNNEIRRFTSGNNPTGIGHSPDFSTFYITSRRALIGPYGDTIKTELTELDGIRNRVAGRMNIESAYMMESVEFTPSGDLALATEIRPKNYVPSIQVEQGFIMTYGIVVVEQKENGKVAQLLIDEPNQYYSDPFDIVISPDGKKAFMTSSGVNTISVIDIDSVRSILRNSSPELLRNYSNNLGVSKRFITRRIRTGADPKGLALSPDGKLLYVAEQLDDKIGIINTETLEKQGSIDLGGPKRITVARRGRQLFNNSGATFQYQFDCYTCHPDNHEDGLIYNMASKDMGRNITNTQSLREIRETPPYKWNGKNQTVYKQDGMRFSTVLTRTEAFSYKDLDAITAYILTGIKYPPNLVYNPAGKLTEAQLRGKAVFERSKDNSGNELPVNGRCVTCHPAPFYTNLKLEDVGTLAKSDDSIKFDTPHLNNIYASPPYLHDGRAETLEEIWTIYGKEDKHGVVNDLSKNQLNDLVEYLKSLRSPAYDTKTTKVHTASVKTNQY
jgi:YVTN family beta-propeller protein